MYRKSRKIIDGAVINREICQNAPNDLSTCESTHSSFTYPVLVALQIRALTLHVILMHQQYGHQT